MNFKRPSNKNAILKSSENKKAMDGRSQAGFAIENITGCSQDALVILLANISEMVLLHVVWSKQAKEWRAYSLAS